MLIESQAHRGNLTSALKLLEEASDLHVTIPERHLRHLRSRCERLHINHPDMPKDPRKWSRELKKVRKMAAKDSQRRIEGVRSALYN